MLTKGGAGFTLVELMITIAVIGILSAVAIPKFGGMLRNAKEADVKSRLGLLRSALNIYYADNLANFPVASAGDNQTTLQTTLTPKYMPSIPECYIYPHHNKTTSVDNVSDNNFFVADSSCDGEWVYLSNKDDTNWGLVAVECYHQDSKGRVWSSY